MNVTDLQDKFTKMNSVKTSNFYLTHFIQGCFKLKITKNDEIFCNDIHNEKLNRINTYICDSF